MQPDADSALPPVPPCAVVKGSSRVLPLDGLPRIPAGEERVELEEVAHRRLARDLPHGPAGLEIAAAFTGRERVGDLGCEVSRCGTQTGVGVIFKATQMIPIHLP